MIAALDFTLKMVSIRKKRKGLKFKDVAAFYDVPPNEMEQSAPSGSVTAPADIRSAPSGSVTVPGDVKNIMPDEVKGKRLETEGLPDILKSTDTEHREEIAGDVEEQECENTEHAISYTCKICKGSFPSLKSVLSHCAKSKTCSKKLGTYEKAGKRYWKKFRSLSELMKTTALHEEEKSVELKPRKTRKQDQEQNLLSGQGSKHTTFQPYQLRPRTKGQYLPAYQLFRRSI